MSTKNWTEQDVQHYLARRGVSPKSAQAISLKVKEKDFQAAVKDMAIVNGWRYHHHYDSRRSTEGFPDCVMVHAKKQRIIFAELKAEGKEPTGEQQAWLDDLEAVNFLRTNGLKLEVYVWRPADIDAIWRILGR